MALAGDGAHHVSLEAAIATMCQTGADMHCKHKETSSGGLALNAIECWGSAGGRADKRSPGQCSPG